MKNRLYYILISCIFVTVVGNNFAANGSDYISGKIIIPGFMYDTLLKKTNNQVFGKILKIELWDAFYVDSPLDTLIRPEVTIYLDTKVAEASLIEEKKLNSGYEIYYEFRNSLPSTNFIVIVYFKDLPKIFGAIKVENNPNDGKNRANTRYMCNARLKIDQNIIWGLSSVLPAGAKSPNSYDFRIAYAVNTSTGIRNFGFGDIFDSIGDAFEDTVDFVWEEIAEPVAGFVVDKFGQIIMKIIGGYRLVGRLIDGIPARSRTLTESEMEWLKIIFSNSLPDRKRVVITNMLFVKDNAAVTLPGCDGFTFYIHMGDKYSSSPYLVHSIHDNLLVHEMAHVFQIHHYSLWDYWVEGFFNQVLKGESSYNYKVGSNWGDYNYEQQASIVQDCFTVFTQQYSKSNSDDNKCQLQRYVKENIRGNKPFIFTEILSLARSNYESTPLLSDDYRIPVNFLITKKIRIKSCDSKTIILGKN